MRLHGSGLLVWRRGGSRWSDDPVQRREGWRQRKGQESESPSEESIMVVGAGWGVVN